MSTHGIRQIHCEPRIRNPVPSEPDQTDGKQVQKQIEQGHRRQSYEGGDPKRRYQSGHVKVAHFRTQFSTNAIEERQDDPTLLCTAHAYRKPPAYSLDQWLEATWGSRSYNTPSYAHWRA